MWSVSDLASWSISHCHSVSQSVNIELHMCLTIPMPSVCTLDFPPYGRGPARLEAQCSVGPTAAPLPEMLPPVPTWLHCCHCCQNHHRHPADHADTDHENEYVSGKQWCSHNTNDAYSVSALFLPIFPVSHKNQLFSTVLLLPLSNLKKRLTPKIRMSCFVKINSVLFNL